MITALDRAIMKSIDEHDSVSVEFDIESRQYEETKSEDTDANDNSNNKYSLLCDKIITIIIFGMAVLPFGLTDLIYAYNDESCVYIYPEKLDINMKDYLQVCGYTAILVFWYKAITICRHTESHQVNLFDLLIRKDTLQFLVKGVLMVWNIIGAFIFWGELYTNTPCNKVLFNYLFGSIIIKLCGSFIFYINKRNDMQIGSEIP